MPLYKNELFIIVLLISFLNSCAKNIEGDNTTIKYRLLYNDFSNHYIYLENFNLRDSFAMKKLLNFSHCYVYKNQLKEHKAPVIGITFVSSLKGMNGMLWSHDDINWNILGKHYIVTLFFTRSVDYSVQEFPLKKIKYYKNELKKQVVTQEVIKEVLKQNCDIELGSQYAAIPCPKGYHCLD